MKRDYLSQILPLLPGFHDPRRWFVEGLEHLDVARARNRGAILTTAHLGYPRLIPPILHAHGYDVAQVSVKGPAHLWNRLEQEEMLAKGSNLRRWIHARTRVVIPKQRNPRDIVVNLDVRPILDALSRNQAVMIAGDGMRAVDFARLSLLGRIYPFPTGFMKIAMLTKSDILPVFAIDGNRRSQIRVEIHPPLAIDPLGDIVTNLQLFADILDRQIKRTPHLWYRWNLENLFDKTLEWSESEIRHRYDDGWGGGRWSRPRMKKPARAQSGTNNPS
jgi:lauroyl/myristoyl acyltransferase